MRVLIACEESQTVCKAFRAKGHEAYSCDIMPCSGGRPEWHIQGSVFDIIDRDWDMMIGHPPCTYISFVGNVWLNYQKYGQKASERHYKMLDGISFFLKLWECDIPKICLENPRGYIQKFIPETQIIQPYYFGNSCSKTTCLWLKGLPKLEHGEVDTLFYSKTHVDKGEMTKEGAGSEALFGINILKLPQHERAKIRSKTFQGIADAMANQWG